MKTLNGKWAFAIGGALLGGAIVAGIHFYGSETGLFNALNDAGKFVENEISAGGAKAYLNLDGQLAILLGIFVGAPLGALLIGNFKPEFRSDGGFFPTVLKNAAGGFLVMTGILIATESIWGHLAGAATLSGGSWIFLGALCATGVLASLLFGGKSSAAVKPEKSAGKGAEK